MQIVAHDDGGGPSALGIRLEDGVLPTGHTDLTALIKARKGSSTPTRGRSDFYPASPVRCTVQRRYLSSLDRRRYLNFQYTTSFICE